LKQFKTLTALVLALMLVFSVVGTALASGGDLTPSDGDTTTGSYKISVKNSNSRISIEGKEYKAYKIFDAVYGEGTPTPVSYTIKNNSFFFTDTEAKAVLDKYFNFTQSASDATVYVVTEKGTTNARALADELTDIVPAAADGTALGSSATLAEINVPAAGYYLVTGSIKSVANPDQSVETAVALVPVKDDKAETFPKADVPDLKKEITAVKEDGTAIPTDLLDDAGKAAVAKVGSVVEYKLTSTVPDLTGYDDYTYTFTDAMSDGLTYADDAKVYIGGSDTALTATQVEYTKNTNGFTLTIPYDTLKTLTTGDSVEVKYSATVNSSALTYNYEKNTANLEYSKNPGGDETNHTPDQETFVIDLNVDVNKYATDPSTGAKLPGAEFKLFKGTEKSGNVFYKWDTTANKVTWVAENEADTFTTDAQGKLTQQIRGLDQGTYSLLETKAPAGYNPLSRPVEITITATESEDGKTVTYTSEPGTVTGGAIDLSKDHAAQPVDTIDVLNQSGTELPSTGGIGTTIFYIAGIVMVLGAAAIVIARRKAEQE